MAVDAVLSLVHQGKTVLKVVAARNGQHVSSAARALKSWVWEYDRVPSAEETIVIVSGTPLGSVTVVTEDKIMNQVEGDVTSDPRYTRYRETFQEASNNPGRKSGKSDHAYLVPLNEALDGFTLRKTGELWKAANQIVGARYAPEEAASPGEDFSNLKAREVRHLLENLQPIEGLRAVRMQCEINDALDLFQKVLSENLEGELTRSTINAISRWSRRNRR